MAKLGYDATTGTQGAVSNYDIARVIGAASLDVGTLCAHPNVNKYSKIKPLALMADDDTPLELTEDQFKNYKEGVYSKPYGLFPTPATIGEYDIDVGEIDMSSDDEETMRAKTAWEYSQSKIVGDRIVNGEGVEIFARESDFAGYDHFATSPITVEWMDYITDEEGNKTNGVYARVTLNTNNAATYGGVKMSDFLDPNTGTEGYYVSMLVFTKSEMDTPAGDNMHRCAYGYDGMSVTLKNSGTTTAVIGLHNGMLSPISGGTYVFVVVVNNTGAPDYEQSTDGWSEYVKLHYYPRIANYNTIQDSIILEDAVKVVSVNDITGTTLFLTDGMENPYSELYESKNATSISGTNSYSNIVFADNQGTYGVSAKVNEQIPSKKRVLVMKDYIYGNINKSDAYFSYIAQVGGDASGGEDKTGLKPLLTDVPMTGTSNNRANFYVNIVSRDTVEVLWNMTEPDGTATEMKYLFSPTQITFGCVNNVIRGFIFSNIVDTRGKATGMKVTVFYSDYGNITESSFSNVSASPTDDNGNTPFFESANGSSDNITDYGTFKIGLPSTLPSGYSAHPLGGSIDVDFGIYDSYNTYFGSYFYRQTKLDLKQQITS